MAWMNLDITATHGLIPMGISMPMGKLLQSLVRTSGAHKVLEIGTLGGFSTLWLASGMAWSHRVDGQVITLELEPKHAEIAKANFELARDLGAKLAPIDVRVGSATESLAKMVTPAKDHDAFDLVFVDADHVNRMQ